MYNLKKRGLLFTFLAVMILSKCFSQEVFSKENEVISRKTETVSKEAPLFKDVTKDHWAYKQITSLEDKGIINGYSDGSFKPGENVTRAHAAVMIVNALKLDYVGKVPEFSDVSSKHWAAGHIAAAQEAGIINGYKDGTFKPGDNITRGQISVMVMNAFNLEQKGSHKNFSDVPDTHWAYKHIEVLASNGIINGYRDGSFGPGDLTTRAHFSVILSNAIEKKEIPANLTEYKAALASVEEADYTNDSWIIYQEIVKANFVTEKNTQEEVDVATAKIIAAQADLVYKHIPGLDNINTSATVTDESVDVNIKLNWTGKLESLEYIYLDFYNEKTEKYISVYIEKKDMDENGNVDCIKQLNKYFQSGTYKLYYISIDYVDAYEGYLVEGYPEAVITIQNENEDIHPPEIDLDSIKVTIEGSKATIDFECLEELSGLSHVGFTFCNEAREFFTITAYDNEIKETAGGYQISENISWFSLGTYTLESIYVYDNAGNVNYYDKENHNLEKHKFVITLDDFKVPGLDNIETSVAYNDDSIDVNIKLDWLGEFEAIDHIYFGFYDENIEPGIGIDIWKKDIDKNGNIDFLKQLSKYFQSGTYKLDYIYIGYADGTSENYFAKGYPEAVITIQNENEDIHPPEIDLDSIKVTKEGTKVTIDFECLEELSGLKDARFEFYNEDKVSFITSAWDNEIKETVGGYQISQDISWFSLGTYTLERISVSDNAGNSNFYDKENHNLEKHKFEITLDDFKIPGIEDIETSVAYTDDSIDVNIKIDWIGEYDSIDRICFHFYDENIEQDLEIDIYKKDIDENGNIDFLKQLSKYFQSGTYKLYYIDIEYTEGTYEHYSASGYPEAVITIQNENEDVFPPEIDLDSIKVTIEGTKATIDFEYLEELSGLSHVGFTFCNEAREFFTITAFDNEIKETAGGYQISKNISWFSLGTYNLVGIYVCDNVGNENYYDKEDHNLEKHKFEITLDDLKIPGIEDIETSVAYTDDSIDVNIKLDCLEEYETIDCIYFHFSDENIEQGIDIYIYKKDIDKNGNIDFLKQLSKYFRSGSYKLAYIYIRYADGRTYESYSEKGYPEAVITIQNENEDILPPEIDLDSLKITKEGAKAIIDFECVEEKSGLKDISFTFHDGERSYGYEPFTDIK